ncbi:MAG: hypothetical protein WCJ46_04975 [bacterium]
MKKNILFLMLFIGLIFIFGCKGGPLGADPWSAQPVLDFPIAVPGLVQRLAAFGTPNWSGSEAHNGVDLVLNTTVASAKIIAPCKGTITKIEMKSNSFSHPPGQLLLTVEIMVSMDWQVSLNLEPGTTDEALKTSQRDAIKVKVGQKVDTGTEIGTLLRGEQGYTHLHYMAIHMGKQICVYNVSSNEARAIFEAIGTASGTTACY